MPDPEEYPIDDSSLGPDRPLSSDVARSLAEDAIHIYRRRLQGLVCCCPTIDSGGAHTRLYTTETSYTSDSVVLISRHRISPWANSLGIYCHAIDNGNANAAVRVGYIFSKGVRESTVLSVGGASPYDSTTNLDLDKLNANTRHSSPTVTVKVWVIEQAEIYALSIYEEHV